MSRAFFFKCAFGVLKASPKWEPGVRNGAGGTPGLSDAAGSVNQDLRCGLQDLQKG